MRSPPEARSFRILARACFPQTASPLRPVMNTLRILCVPRTLRAHAIRTTHATCIAFFVSRAAAPHHAIAHCVASPRHAFFDFMCCHILGEPEPVGQRKCAMLAAPCKTPLAVFRTHSIYCFRRLARRCMFCKTYSSHRL